MIKTKGTLVILTPGFAASEDDDTCLPMQQSLVRTFRELYPHLQMIILSFQYPYRETKYKWHEVTVYSFAGRNRGGFQRLWLRRKIFRILKELHRKETILGLLSFWYNECAAVGKLFGERHRIPHYCWLLGQDARNRNRYPLSHPLQSKQLIALSHFLQDEFERNYSVRPLHVLPPAINPSHWPEPFGLRDIDILAVGSLIPLKGYEVFLEVVAAVKKELPNVRVVLIGEGPERKRLEAMAKHLALEENVQFTGALPHRVVLSLMQRSKVFLHPSTFEGFGVVCLEALYGGAQVVSFVRPMKQAIGCWHVVKTKEEMAAKASAILQNAHACFCSRNVFPMKETVQTLVDLFVPEK
ncbi:MAG TPA: glycosyltransferase family 4 protein [Flavisolibacter sp.]|nr:glycosyltransferase family 4 protein [Flavisolibacter sp.]